MKSFILSFRFLTAAFLAIQLSLCSSDDGNNSNEQAFEPITIDLTGLNIETDDTAFEAGGFSFTVTNGTSQENVVVDGIGIFGNSGQLEMDLSTVINVSQITVVMFNNGAGSTVIRLMNDGSTLVEITDDDIPAGETSVVLSSDNLTYDTLRIVSAEAVINSIILE
jgi:hypothetical protein